MKRVFVCSHYKRRGGWRAVLMYMCSWHLKRKCPLTTTTTTISTPPTAFTPWCNGWGEGTVSGFPHCGTLWTGVKNSIRTHHNAITVSMPTQPHMGEAYTFHGLWKHGRWIMMGIIELLNPIAVVTVTWGVRVKIRNHTDSIQIWSVWKPLQTLARQCSSQATGYGAQLQLQDQTQAGNLLQRRTSCQKTFYVSVIL